MATPPLPAQTFADFRDLALRLLGADVAPEAAAPHWHAFAAAHPAGATCSAPACGQLFGTEPAIPTAAGLLPAITLPRFILTLMQRASLHRAPDRYLLLYRVLWRLQREPALRRDLLDADLMRLRQLARAVARDAYKMRAFVRFRPVALHEDESSHASAADSAPAPEAAACVLHIAWYLPEHDVLPSVAPWFARRFAGMDWLILTPTRSARWYCARQALQHGPGAPAESAPPPDTGEALWRTYYRHTFNPDRLNLRQMQQHMPRKYWAQLPEAQDIGLLVARARGQG